MYLSNIQTGFIAITLSIMNTSPSVSFFERLYLPSSNPLTLEEIIILIRTRRWEREITAYRAALATGNKEGAAQLKTQLSGFTPSGLFDAATVPTS